jgi:hypothetical protein
MGFLTIIAPYIPQIIKMVNGAIKGNGKGTDKMNAAANITDILLRSIDPNAKLSGESITSAIQAVFDQMKVTGEVDGPKEVIGNEKFYLIRASRVQEL